jgi:hypothetical protein
MPHVNDLPKVFLQNECVACKQILTLAGGGGVRKNIMVIAATAVIARSHYPALAKVL